MCYYALPTKYPLQPLLLSILQALIYFADVVESECSISLQGQSWESKKNIQQQVNNYLK
jgi:hypothetical protein